jgi:hypothetical protein
MFMVPRAVAEESPPPLPLLIMHLEHNMELFKQELLSIEISSRYEAVYS